jgi:hypothetical protein
MRCQMYNRKRPARRAATGEILKGPNRISVDNTTKSLDANPHRSVWGSQQTETLGRMVTTTSTVGQNRRETQPVRPSIWQGREGAVSAACRFEVR